MLHTGGAATPGWPGNPGGPGYPYMKNHGNQHI